MYNIYWNEDISQNLNCECLYQEVQVKTVHFQVMQLLRSKVQPRIETDLPSVVLDYLQNQYPVEQALSIMKHVLGAMNYHHQGSKMGSYVALIEEYEHKLKDLLISEHFVGRTNDLWEILQMFSLKSDTQGKH